MRCFNDNSGHVGPLKRLATFSGIDTERAVMWCPRCGAVVIDVLVNGRRMGQMVSMRFPEITKEARRKGELQ